MDLATEVLIEVKRLQTLVFIHGSSPRNPRTLHELSEWLRVPPQSADAIAEELTDEGFLTPLPVGPARFRTALELTPTGEGLLQWFQRRSRAEPSPQPEPAPAPLLAR